MTIDIKVGAAPGVGTVDFERQFLEPEIECASREEIAELQEKRILELVPYAWERSAFYRDLWSAAGVNPDAIRSTADFIAKVPTMCKDDIKAYRARTGDPFGGLLCVDAAELTSITSTSGTTSLPEPIPEIWTVAPPLPTISARDLWGLGLRPGDRVMVPTGTLRNHWDDFFQMLGLVPVFVDSWIGEGEQVLKAVERHQIAYLQLLMPTVLEFERLEAKYDIKSMLASLKGAAFAGQPLGKVLTQKVREDWGVNLYTYTSAGDTGTAWEGSEHDGYFLWEDTVLAEILDPVTSAPVGDRELGELVATDLDNWASPYIRFRSGDLVRVTRQPAPSGRTHARMWVAGRRGDEIVINDKAVMLSDVWQLVESVPECCDGIFQIVRFAPEMNRLRVRVGYAPDRTGDLNELGSRAAKVLEGGLGVGADVELITCDELLNRSSSVAKLPRVVKA
jgi:phenylacetate-CoA ligase